MSYLTNRHRNWYDTNIGEAWHRLPMIRTRASSFIYWSGKYIKSRMIRSVILVHISCMSADWCKEWHKCLWEGRDKRHTRPFDWLKNKSFMTFKKNVILSLMTYIEWILYARPRIWYRFFSIMNAECDPALTRNVCPIKGEFWAFMEADAGFDRGAFFWAYFWTFMQTLKPMITRHLFLGRFVDASNFEKVLWKNSIGLKSEQPIYQSSGHLIERAAGTVGYLW